MILVLILQVSSSLHSGHIKVNVGKKNIFDGQKDFSDKE